MSKPRQHFWQRNTTGLRDATKRRVEGTRQRVTRAMSDLLDHRVALTFTAVAEAAGVSKRYLYSQPDIRLRIESLRAST